MVLSTPARRKFAIFCLGAVSFAAIALALTALVALRDCGAPGGACYQREEVQRQANIRILRQTSIAANWCTLREAANPPPPSYDAIRRCVDRRLALLDKP